VRSRGSLGTSSATPAFPWFSVISNTIVNRSRLSIPPRKAHRTKTAIVGRAVLSVWSLAWELISAGHRVRLIDRDEDGSDSGFASPFVDTNVCNVSADGCAGFCPQRSICERSDWIDSRYSHRFADCGRAIATAHRDRCRFGPVWCYYLAEDRRGSRRDGRAMIAYWPESNNRVRRCSRGT